MWVYLVEVIVFALGYYILCMERNREKARYKVVLQPVNLLAVSLIATGMCFFVNFQLPIVNNVLPDNIVQQYSNMIDQAGYGVELIPTIICLLLAPLAEEFLFRGIMFYYLVKIFEIGFSKRKAFWIANTIQAFLFGLFHLNPIQGGYAFLVGLVLGFLVHQYESIIPAIITHMINNFLSAFVWRVLVEALPQNSGTYTIGTGFSLCLIVLGMMLCIVNSEN